MSDKLEDLGQLSRVELVHPDLFVVLAGKKVTTVREYDFAALLNWQLLVHHELLVQDVHQADIVAEANHKVQARGMERNCVRLHILRRVAQLRLEHVCCSVRPQAHGSVRRACRDQLLLDANI